MSQVLNETLMTALGCLSRRMPDGSIEIEYEEIEELETDLDYYGIAVKLTDGGINITPLELNDVFYLKEEKPKKSFIKRLLRLE